MAATSSLYASNESIFQERVFANSTTWSPGFNCRAYVTVIGPGGSGASRRNTTVNQAQAASGGGAGGCAKSLLTLSSSVTYTITIGSGGASVNGGAGVNGGANSVFSGSDISTMTANLGNGGVQAGGGATVSAQAGGTGGAASGGNIWNITGGAGGSAEISYYSASGGHWASGGGGAAGILGEAFRGGNALTSTGGYNKMALGGGAGVGGNGGDATVTAGSGSGSDWPQVMAGGGMGFRDGFSYNLSSSLSTGAWAANKYDITCHQGEVLPWLTSGNMANAGINAYQMYDSQQTSQGRSQSIFHGLTGVCGGNFQGASSRFSGPGAGGSGYWSSGDSTYAYASAGLFGGGAGTSTNYYNSQYGGQNGYGSRGSFGAGGGAMSAFANSSNVSQSGAGGPGLIVVTVLEVL